MTNISFNNAVNAYKEAANMKGGIAASLKNDDNKPDFSEVFTKALSGAQSAGYKGESVSAAAIAGKAELHELVTAVTNSELTLQTVVAVRDKMISAYQDIIKMPI